MVTRSSLIPLVVLLSAITVGATTGRAQQPDAEIENVRAFAKLYGYVRWFHPADEAALVDWDRFAIEGVRKVRPAETTAELRGALEALFRPIAPWVRVYPEGTSPKVPALVPPDTTGLVVVAWQHQGVGLSRGSQYQSVRLNRPPLLREPVGILYLQRSAADLRGRQIRLSAFAQLLPPGGEASALRLFLEDGEGRRHNSPNFHADTVVAVVAENADSVTLGAVLEGTGEGRLQRLRLKYRKRTAGI